MSSDQTTSLICLAVLLAGCSPSTPPQQASPAPSSVASNVTVLTEDRAVALLEAALKANKVADLDCLGFVAENNTSDSKASLWEFAAREIHDERCGGDPTTSPVRDRYRVSSNGEVSVHDFASDEYTAL